MRLTVRQHEVNPLACGHGELGDGGEVHASQRHVTGQQHEVRAGDGAQSGSVLQPRHPRHGRAVVEAEGEIEPHRHFTAAALDDTDQRGIAGGGGHEVDQCDAAVLGVEHGLQDQRAGTILAADPDRSIVRRDPPPPVVRLADQGREARRTVEPRQAQPVDRAVAIDQCSATAIADQRVILDRRYLQVGIRRRGFGIASWPSAGTPPGATLGGRAVAG